MKRAWRDWLLVAGWMTVMFTMSGSAGSGEHTAVVIEPVLRWVNPDVTPETVGVAHHWTRKAAHFFEYFVLGLLTLRAVRSSLRIPSRTWNWPAARWTLLIVVIFAISDEWHQSFVPTRGPMIADGLLDGCGAVCGLLAAWLGTKRGREKAPETQNDAAATEEVRSQRSEIREPRINANAGNILEGNFRQDASF